MQLLGKPSSRLSEDAERRIAVTIEQFRNDLARMHRVQQTMFAFVDTLAKALLTGLPEQSSASVARGNERYERFLRSAAASMLAITSQARSGSGECPVA